MKELYAYRERMMSHWEATPAALREAVSRIPAADWHRRGGAGESTLHQVLAHLRDIERDVIFPSITRLLAGETDLSLPFPAWETWLATYNPDESPQDVLETCLSLHAGEIARVRSHVPIPWSVEGRHPQYGKRTLQWWVEQSLAQARAHYKLLCTGRGAR